MSALGDVHRSWRAADMLTPRESMPPSRDEQEWLVTDASVYHATAPEDGLWRQYGRYARSEIKAFLRDLVEGVPLFGQRPPDDAPDAAIGLEKLHSFRAGLEDFRAQV